MYFDVCVMKYIHSFGNQTVKYVKDTFLIHRIFLDMNVYYFYFNCNNEINECQDWYLVLIYGRDIDVRTVATSWPPKFLP